MVTPSLRPPPMFSDIACAPGLDSALKEMSTVEGLKFMTFRINDESTLIDVEKRFGSIGEGVDYLLDLDDHYRWALASVSPKEGGGPGDVLVFITWTPDKCGIMERVMYTRVAWKMRAAVPDYVKVGVVATSAKDFSIDIIEEAARYFGQRRLDGLASGSSYLGGRSLDGGSRLLPRAAPPAAPPKAAVEDLGAAAAAAAGHRGFSLLSAFVLLMAILVAVPCLRRCRRKGRGDGAEAIATTLIGGGRGVEDGGGGGRRG